MKNLFVVVKMIINNSCFGGMPADVSTSLPLSERALAWGLRPHSVCLALGYPAPWPTKRREERMLISNMSSNLNCKVCIAKSCSHNFPQMHEARCSRNDLVKSVGILD